MKKQELIKGFGYISKLLKKNIKKSFKKRILIVIYLYNNILFLFVNTTKIIEEVSLTRFNSIISKSKIDVSPHAFDHLSYAQRQLFTEEKLIKILLKEKPCGIGLQLNGRYASFYKRKRDYLRIIFAVNQSKIEIITFINTQTKPNLKRLKK